MGTIKTRRASGQQNDAGHHRETANKTFPKSPDDHCIHGTRWATLPENGEGDRHLSGGKETESMPFIKRVLGRARASPIAHRSGVEARRCLGAEPGYRRQAAESTIRPREDSRPR